MKIAFVSTFLPQRCGIATYTDYLTRAMRKVDPSLHIKIIAERYASSLREENFEVVPCWDRKGDYVAPILKEAEGFDLVHVEHEYSIYGFDERLPTLLKKLPAKKVITIHCVRPAQFSERGRVDEDYAAKVASLADAVIVHLPTQKDILVRKGIPPEKIEVIPHGTEIIEEDPLESRKRLGLPVEDKILLMFGFVKRHKCIHVALEALKQVREKRKDVKLFIAGGLAPNARETDRLYAEEIERKIKELGLEDAVIYPNKFFPNEDVPYLFSAVDAVLFPYYEEDRSASGSFHLAIGAGKPVIASRIPKFEELSNICDELLILPFNSSGLAQVILRLFEDREFREYVVKRTLDYRRKTSWEETAKRHLSLYRRVLYGSG